MRTHRDDVVHRFLHVCACVCVFVYGGVGWVSKSSWYDVFTWYEKTVRVHAAVFVSSGELLFLF